MYLTKEDVVKILEVMNDFNDAKNFKLEVDNSSGIGSIITLVMNMDIRGHSSVIKVVISGEEKW